MTVVGWGSWTGVTWSAMLARTALLACQSFMPGRKSSNAVPRYCRRFAVGVVYPTLKSFEAIESPGSKDDEQWLTYWVVYSFVNIVEHLLWVVLMWYVFMCVSYAACCVLCDY